MDDQSDDAKRKATLAALSDAYDVLLDDGFGTVDADEARALLVEFETHRRRLEAVQVSLMSEIGSRGLHLVDGHFSAQTMVKHACQLSGAEIARQRKWIAARPFLPAVDEALALGSVGIEQARLIGKVFTNPRVREQLIEAEAMILGWAETMSFKNFASHLGNWERLTDEDGPTPANERANQNRKIRMSQDHFSRQWETSISLGVMDGAEFHAILTRYEEAEWEVDWDHAKAKFGDGNFSATDLARTPDQRRADAFMHLIRDGARNPGEGVVPGFVHNIVWDQATYEEMASRFEGNEAQPLDPETYCCETLDGHQLEPTEAFANSILNEIRRVVVNAKSTVIDLGRKRFFTGHARHAVMLQSNECVWPGCEIPTTKCQADHLTEHSRGGEANPENGAPLCGGHNRWKDKGYEIHLTETGTWKTTRPDGKEIL